MDLIVKFLFLSGKYITCAAGKTILEVINQSVKIKRHVARKYEHITQMVGPYDNMLELMNARIEENAIADMAWSPEALMKEINFDVDVSEASYNNDELEMTAPRRDKEFEQIFAEWYEELCRSSTELKHEMMNNNKISQQNYATKQRYTCGATLQPKLVKQHFYGTCANDQYKLKMGNCKNLVPLSDRNAYMNKLVTESPDDSYYKKNRFPIRTKKPVNVHSSAGVHNFKKSLLAHDDTIDLATKDFVADLKQEINYRTYTYTDKLERLTNSATCATTLKRWQARHHVCCRRLSSWQAFESNLERKLQKKIYRIITRDVTSLSYMSDNDYKDIDSQNRLDADVIKVNELAFNKLEQKVTQILIQQNLRDIEEALRTKNRMRTLFPAVKRLNFDEICSNTSARIQNAVIKSLWEKKHANGIGDIIELLENELQPAIFNGKCDASENENLNIHQVVPATNIASPPDEMMILREKIEDEKKIKIPKALKSDLTDEQMKDIQQRTDILESNWRAFRIFEEYLQNVMIFDKRNEPKTKSSESKANNLFGGFSIEAIYNSLFNRSRHNDNSNLIAIKDDIALEATKINNNENSRGNKSFMELLTEQIQNKLNFDQLNSSNMDKESLNLMIADSIKDPSSSTKTVQSDFIITTPTQSSKSVVSDFVVAASGDKRFKGSNYNNYKETDQKNNSENSLKRMKKDVYNFDPEMDEDDEEILSVQKCCDRECNHHERDLANEAIIESFNQELYSQADYVEPSVADLVTRLMDKPTDHLTLEPVEPNVLVFPESHSYMSCLEEIDNYEDEYYDNKYHPSPKLPNQKLINIEKELKEIKTQLKSLSTSCLMPSGGFDMIDDGKIAEYVLPKRKSKSDTNIAVTTGHQKKILLNIYIPKNCGSNKLPISSSKIPTVLMQHHSKSNKMIDVKQISNLATEKSGSVCIDPDRVLKLQRSLQFKQIDSDQLTQVTEKLTPPKPKNKPFPRIDIAKLMDVQKKLSDVPKSVAAGFVSQIDPIQLNKLRDNLEPAFNKIAVENNPLRVVPRFEYVSLPQEEDDVEDEIELQENEENEMDLWKSANLAIKQLKEEAKMADRDEEDDEDIIKYYQEDRSEINNIENFNEFISIVKVMDLPKESNFEFDASSSLEEDWIRLNMLETKSKITERKEERNVVRELIYKDDDAEEENQKLIDQKEYEREILGLEQFKQRYFSREYDKENNDNKLNKQGKFKKIDLKDEKLSLCNKIECKDKEIINKNKEDENIKPRLVKKITYDGVKPSQARENLLVEKPIKRIQLKDFTENVKKILNENLNNSLKEDLNKTLNENMNKTLNENLNKTLNEKEAKALNEKVIKVKEKRKGKGRGGSGGGSARKSNKGSIRVKKNDEKLDVESVEKIKKEKVNFKDVSSDFKVTDSKESILIDGKEKVFDTQSANRNESETKIQNAALNVTQSGIGTETQNRVQNADFNVSQSEIQNATQNKIQNTDFNVTEHSEIRNATQNKIQNLDSNVTQRCGIRNATQNKIENVDINVTQQSDIRNATQNKIQDVDFNVTQQNEHRNATQNKIQNVDFNVTQQSEIRNATQNKIQNAGLNVIQSDIRNATQNKVHIEAHNESQKIQTLQELQSNLERKREEELSKIEEASRKIQQFQENQEYLKQMELRREKEIKKIREAVQKVQLLQEKQELERRKELERQQNMQKVKQEIPRFEFKSIQKDIENNFNFKRENKSQVQRNQDVQNEVTFKTDVNKLEEHAQHKFRRYPDQNKLQDAFQKVEVSQNLQKKSILKKDQDVKIIQSVRPENQSVQPSPAQSKKEEVHQDYDFNISDEDHEDIQENREFQMIQEFQKRIELRRDEELRKMNDEKKFSNAQEFKKSQEFEKAQKNQDSREFQMIQEFQKRIELRRDEELRKINDEFKKNQEFETIQNFGKVKEFEKSNEEEQELENIPAFTRLQEPKPAQDQDFKNVPKRTKVQKPTFAKVQQFKNVPDFTKIREIKSESKNVQKSKNTQEKEQDIKNVGFQTVQQSQKPENLTQNDGDLTQKMKNLTESSTNLNQKTQNLIKKFDDLNKKSEDLSKKCNDLNKKSEDLNKKPKDLNKKSDDKNQTPLNFKPMQEFKLQKLDVKLQLPKDSQIVDLKAQDVSQKSQHIKMENISKVEKEMDKNNQKDPEYSADVINVNYNQNNVIARIQFKEGSKPNQFFEKFLFNSNALMSRIGFNKQVKSDKMVLKDSKLKNDKVDSINKSDLKVKVEPIIEREKNENDNSDDLRKSFKTIFPFVPNVMNYNENVPILLAANTVKNVETKSLDENKVSFSSANEQPPKVDRQVRNVSCVKREILDGDIEYIIDKNSEKSTENRRKYVRTEFVEETDDVNKETDKGKAAELIIEDKVKINETTKEEIKVESNLTRTKRDRRLIEVLIPNQALFTNNSVSKTPTLEASLIVDKISNPTKNDSINNNSILNDSVINVAEETPSLESTTQSQDILDKTVKVHFQNASKPKPNAVEDVENQSDLNNKSINHDLINLQDTKNKKQDVAQQINANKKDSEIKPSITTKEIKEVKKNDEVKPPVEIKKKVAQKVKTITAKPKKEVVKEDKTVEEIKPKMTAVDSKTVAPTKTVEQKGEIVEVKAPVETKKAPALETKKVEIKPKVVTLHAAKTVGDVTPKKPIEQKAQVIEVKPSAETKKEIAQEMKKIEVVQSVETKNVIQETKAIEENEMAQDTKTPSEMKQVVSLQSLPGPIPPPQSSGSSDNGNGGKPKPESSMEQFLGFKDHKIKAVAFEIKPGTPTPKSPKLKWEKFGDYEKPMMTLLIPDAAKPESDSIQLNKKPPVFQFKPEANYLKLTATENIYVEEIKLPTAKEERRLQKIDANTFKSAPSQSVIKVTEELLEKSETENRDILLEEIFSEKKPTSNNNPLGNCKLLVREDIEIGRKSTHKLEQEFDEFEAKFVSSGPPETKSSIKTDSNKKKESVKVAIETSTQNLKSITNEEETLNQTSCDLGKIPVVLEQPSPGLTPISSGLNQPPSSPPPSPVPSPLLLKPAIIPQQEKINPPKQENMNPPKPMRSEELNNYQKPQQKDQLFSKRQISLKVQEKVIPPKSMKSDEGNLQKISLPKAVMDQLFFKKQRNIKSAPAKNDVKDPNLPTTYKLLDSKFKALNQFKVIQQDPSIKVKIRVKQENGNAKNLQSVLQKSPVSNNSDHRQTMVLKSTAQIQHPQFDCRLDEKVQLQEKIQQFESKVPKNPSASNANPIQALQPQPQLPIQSKPTKKEMKAKESLFIETNKQHEEVADKKDSRDFQLRLMSNECQEKLMEKTPSKATLFVQKSFEFKPLRNNQQSYKEESSAPAKTEPISPKSGNIIKSYEFNYMEPTSLALKTTATTENTLEEDLKKVKAIEQETKESKEIKKEESKEVEKVEEKKEVKKAEEKKVAEENKKVAEEKKKVAEEIKKIAEEKKKVAEEKMKIAEEKKRVAEEMKKVAEEKKKIILEEKKKIMLEEKNKIVLEEKKKNIVGDRKKNILEEKKGTVEEKRLSREDENDHIFNNFEYPPPAIPEQIKFSIQAKKPEETSKKTDFIPEQKRLKDNELKFKTFERKPINKVYEELLNQRIQSVETQRALQEDNLEKSEEIESENEFISKTERERRQKSAAMISKLFKVRTVQQQKHNQKSEEFKTNPAMNLVISKPFKEISKSVSTDNVRLNHPKYSQDTLHSRSKTLSDIDTNKIKASKYNYSHYYTNKILNENVEDKKESKKSLSKNNKEKQDDLSDIIEDDKEDCVAKPLKVSNVLGVNKYFDVEGDQSATSKISEMNKAETGLTEPSPRYRRRNLHYGTGNENLSSARPLKLKKGVIPVTITPDVNLEEQRPQYKSSYINEETGDNFGLEDGATISPEKTSKRKKAPNYLAKTSLDAVDHTMNMTNAIKWKGIEATAKTNIDKTNTPFDLKHPKRKIRSPDRSKPAPNHLGMLWPRSKGEDISMALDRMDKTHKVFSTHPTSEMSTSAVLDTVSPNHESKSEIEQDKTTCEGEASKVVYSFDDHYRKSGDDHEIQQKKKDYWKTLQREDKWCPIPTETTIANELYGNKVYMRKPLKKMMGNVNKALEFESFDSHFGLGDPAREEREMKRIKQALELEQLTAERKLKLKQAEEERDRRKFGNVSPLLMYYLKQKEEKTANPPIRVVDQPGVFNEFSETSKTKSFPNEYKMQRIWDDKKSVINVPTEGGSIYDRYPLLRKQRKRQKTEAELQAEQEAEYEDRIRVEQQKREAERLSAQASLMAEERSRGIERKASFANQTAVRFQHEPYGNKVSNMMKWKLRYNAHIEKLNTSGGKKHEENKLVKKFPFLRKYQKGSDQNWPESTPTTNWDQYAQLPYNPNATGLRNIKPFDGPVLDLPSSVGEAILPDTKKYIFKEKELKTALGKNIKVTYLVPQDPNAI